jgi:predicted nucleotidyltransferase
MKTQMIKTKGFQNGTPALDRYPASLRELVRQIVMAVRPLKIILFGSRARGDARLDSDYDLAVVMPEGAHRRHTSQKLHRQVLVMELEYDLLIATRGDLEKYGAHPSLIYKYILGEGVDLYVA